MKLAIRLRRILTWNELEALKAIYKVVGNKSECLINTTDISKELNVSRSSITMLFRILEAVGVLEAKSAGMRGTHLAIENHDIIQQVIGK
ncbi:MAG: hypothetical protein ACRCX8_05775 [Sarcina sp.]